MVKDGRYDIIETGSLISIKENVSNILVPSEEHAISMYPMDFEEFLWACGEQPLAAYIKECFAKKQALEEPIHRKAMLLFKQYMIVGGMPQSVAAYLDNDLSFQAADARKRDILALYRSDIGKADAAYRTKVLAIFNQIPGFLSKHEKTVVFNKSGSPKGASGMTEAFFWLQDSMMANLRLMSRDPNIGLALNADEAKVKCYMGDTGLLISQTFTEEEIKEGETYKKLMNDRLSINQGMFYENLVAQMLTCAGHPLYFYAHYNPAMHRNDIEIDFLLSAGILSQYRLHPIEVKSSKNYTTTSLHAFREYFFRRVSHSYVIHPKNLKEEDGITYLPVYMTYLL